MADEIDLGASEANGFDEQPLPQVTILVQYVKDLSFENPNAPMSLQAGGQPKIEVNVAVNAKRAGDAVYEAELKITAKATATASPKITPETRAMAISAAMIVPDPKGLVRINISPGTAPALVIARAASPVTVKPIVNSAPTDVCPPTTSAPAAPKTAAASAMISASISDPFSGDIRGKMICASATCGSAPIAQMSPIAWIAAIRAISRASRVKLRK